MRYLILSQANMAYGRSVSAALYALSRPAAARSPDDVTTHWCAVITHPVTGGVALALPDDKMPVHGNAPDSDLPSLIAAAITQTEREKMVEDIRANRGKQVEPPVFLPASVVANLRTREQMAADGWIAGGA